MSNRGGTRIGAGRTPLPKEEKKTACKIYLTQSLLKKVEFYGCGKNLSEKASDLLLSEVKKRKIIGKKKVRFIDLFAGLGGMRLGFEEAFKRVGFETECVLTSEIKPYAIQALKENFKHEKIVGDITQVSTSEIPDFDFLLGGFPCQAFSSAGKGHGFLDTRGTLFFEVERILKEKKPYGFLLENVEGLVRHDPENPKDKIGRTLDIILKSLQALGYKVSWEVLDSQNFGVAQSRKRIYIVGTMDKTISLKKFSYSEKKIKSITEKGLPTLDSKFSKQLFSHFSPEELYGKSIKDKRGGKNNIHSWDIEMKGSINPEQKRILEILLKERRKKQWASEIGIDWMDGMPLTEEQISTFFSSDKLGELLKDLVAKGYLAYEHPKKLVKIDVGDGKLRTERQPDKTKPKGYNIVAGKLSFEFSKILDPEGVAPTLVAMDVSKIGVVDGDGIRRLTLREGLRLCGYPEKYNLDFLNGTKNGNSLGFDLLGNTVTVPVVEEICNKLSLNYQRFLIKN